MGRVAVALLAVVLATGRAGAEIRTVDPNQAATLAAAPDGSRAGEAPARPAASAPAPDDAFPPAAEPQGQAQSSPPPPPSAGVAPPPAATGAERAARASAENSYKEQDVLTAADGVFGKGTAELGKLIQRIFRDQGQPTAYIAGHEAGGAFVVGLRYGSGTLFHKVEGQRPIYWTGPSVGFDLGASGAKTFVLVYNLYDTQDLYHRFPQVEGQAYFVGGFNASYLRWGHIVVIPIRLGVGWRLGANIGYMNFTAKSRWVPF